MMKLLAVLKLNLILCLLTTSVAARHVGKRTTSPPECKGNGFVGNGCEDVYGRTGQPKGFAELVSSGSVAEVCQGDRLAVMQDCRYRNPLYVGVSFDRAQIDADNPGRHNGAWNASEHLDQEFQAEEESDYDSLSTRIWCYERQSDHVLYHDMFWTGRADKCVANSEKDLTVSHGHMIADSYIRLPESDKAATYYVTNCVPQFQDFNGQAWNQAERALIDWSQLHCGSAIDDSSVRSNARFYTIVGAVPSPSVNRTFEESNVEPRWMGQYGFGDGEFTARIDYNGQQPSSDHAYRMAVPAAMFTVACCVATDDNNNVAWVHHTAFGRNAKPDGKEKVVMADSATLIERMLPEYHTADVDFFPKEPGCSDPDNYIRLL